MAKKRVHELAKEINVSNKEIKDFLNSIGVEVKSHMSSVPEDKIQAVIDNFTQTSEKKSKSEKTPKKAKAKDKKAEKKEKPKKEAKTEKKKEKPEKKKETKKAEKPKKEAKKETKTKKEEGKKAKSKPSSSDKKSKKESVKKEEKSKETKEKQEKPKKKEEKKYEPGELGIIEVSEFTTVRQLAAKMGRKTKEVMLKLKEKGVNAGANQMLDFELIEEIAGEFGYLVDKIPYEHEALAELEKPDPEDKLKERPPIVTLMGHVDHGKTSLLDKIRHSRITAKEAGGITQHIGAYQVEFNGKKITFLDTPGHEAFTKMRARGANVTDIVILVVAADEGIKPQTIEAINHAKSAGVAIIVAVNKIDKPEANPDMVKRQLLEHDLVVEDYGGDVVSVNVSAKTGQGIDELLEYILLIAEILELKANPDRKAKGYIIEARVDKGRGPVATVLVQNGTLKRGDVFTCGFTYGKVRGMFNDLGKQVKDAPPSTPVEVLGFNSIPDAGDKFYVVDSEQVAKEIAEVKKIREEAAREKKQPKKLSLEDLFKKMEEGEIKELPIVLKCDVQGSLETIEALLNKLSNPEVKINIIHKAVGAISENDVLLASASNAIILGFHVKADKKTMKLAEQEGIDIRIHNIIYELTNEIKAAIEGMLEPEIKEEVIGRLEVRQVFKVPKVGFVAGCYVLEGEITRNSQVRVYRDNILIHEGRVSSLKRFKNDVSEVKAGYECGLTIENLKDIREGDEIEAFKTVKVKKTLDSLEGKKSSK